MKPGKLFCLLLVLFGFLVAHAYAADQAIVSTRTIYPGQLIKAEELIAVELYKKPTIRYRFAVHMDEIVGLVATRTILKGRFIPISSARPAPVIKAGTRTRVHYKSGGLSIDLVAVALSDGALGQTVRLRNPSSGKIISGFIRSDGSVVAKEL